LKDVKQKIGVQKHIRIDDTGISEQIDRIMQLPEYKSFNKVINDALFYGLPVLTEKLFAGATLPKDENELPNKRENNNEKDEGFYALIVKLLRETVLNVTINKSILSSLFNAKIIEYKGGKVHEDFSQGLMSDTPDYLNDFGLSELKKLRG
jgi:hypothetical protein